MYPGLRRELFEGDGKGGWLRRDIIHEATQALTGVVRLATEAEIDAGKPDASLPGPVVVNLAQLVARALTPLQNLLAALNAEITARANGDNALSGQLAALQTSLQAALNSEASSRASGDASLQGKINGLQSLINNGLGECIVYTAEGLKHGQTYPHVYLPAGGTWLCFHSGNRSGHFFLIVDSVEPAYDQDNGAALGAWWYKGFELLAGGSEVHIGSYLEDTQYARDVGAAVIAWRVGEHHSVKGQ